MHALDPIEFDQIPQISGFASCQVGMDKIHNMDFNIWQTLVVAGVEMFADHSSGFVCTDAVEMGLKSVN